MKRITHPTTASELPTPAETGDPGYFTGGNPGIGVPATRLTADWANRVQEEICAVVEDVGGVSLDGEDNGQMAAALHGARGIRSGDAGGVSGPTPDQAAVVASSAGTADGLTSLVGASSGSRTNAGGWDTAVLASSGGVAVGNQSAVIASRDTSPSTPCEVHGDRSAIMASSVATIPTGAAQTAIVGSTSAEAAATTSNALAAASSSASLDGDQVAVIAGGGSTGASSSKAAAIAGDGSATGTKAAVLGGDGTASGTAAAVIASDSDCEASVSRSAVIASQNSDAGAATKANAAAVASVNSAATGDQTASLASQGAVVSGTNAAAVASVSSQASGAQSAALASQGGIASGDNAAVLASTSAIASGDQAAVIGSSDSDATAARAVTVASRYTINDIAQSIAGGDDPTGTPEPSTGNQTWRIESVTGLITCDSLTETGADYAELFPNASPGTLPHGRLVALEGEAVRLAGPGDDPIGITSARPAILGDAAWSSWSGRWVRDVFGAYVLDDEGRRIQSPDYDPARPYVPRTQRPDEWTAVGLVGKLPLAIDQTVKPGDYVRPGPHGIGTKSAKRTGVRAMIILAEHDQDAGYAVARCLVR